jgi:SAM-dependent methyltransferase
MGHSAVAFGDDAFRVYDNTLDLLLQAAPRGGTVLDVGCHGWAMVALAAELGRTDLQHIGADMTEHPPPDCPPGSAFLSMPADGAVFSDPVADLTVSRHSLEHSSRPVALFGAMLGATKPGGLLYVEAPSELSCARSSATDPRDHSFRCFWDDPTHVRPWPPAALYRLAIGFGATPLQCGRMSRWGIPSAAIVARKAQHANGYRYVSLKDAAFGVEAAMETIWGVNGTS